MQIIPAIDLREGRVVRLAQGDYARQTLYPSRSDAALANLRAAGARWLHVVDLDGARAGAMHNLRVIAAIAATGRLSLQAGGGVRTREDLERLFDAGVTRVVVGSVAVTDPDAVRKWISRHGAERICIALDTRQEFEKLAPARAWLDFGFGADPR